MHKKIMNEGIRSAFKKYLKKFSRKQIEKIAEYADPTPKKKYLEWLCKQAVDFNLQDLWFGSQDDRINALYMNLYFTTLKQFEFLVQRNQLVGKEADINSYESYISVWQKVKDKYFEYKLEQGKKNEKAPSFWHNGFHIYYITNISQAIKYGANTKWCISAKTATNQFEKYYEKNHIFILITENVKYAVLINRQDFQKFNVFNEQDLNISLKWDVYRTIPKEVFMKIINQSPIKEGTNSAFAKFKRLLPNEDKAWFHRLSNVDPTSQKKYLDKMVEWFAVYVNNNQDIYDVWDQRDRQDFERGKDAQTRMIGDAIHTFHYLIKNHRISGRVADIQSYKDYYDLKRFVDEQQYSLSNRQKKIATSHKGVEFIFQNDKYIMYKLKTPEASSFFCKGTGWCIRFRDSFVSRISRLTNLYYINEKGTDNKYIVEMMVDHFYSWVHYSKTGGGNGFGDTDEPW